jgi:hypothetical protein
MNDIGSKIKAWNNRGEGQEIFNRLNMIEYSVYKGLQGKKPTTYSQFNETSVSSLSYMYLSLV